MLQVPYAFDLLAQRLVLWRDGEGQWRCFEDRCALNARSTLLPLARASV